MVKILVIGVLKKARDRNKLLCRNEAGGNWKEKVPSLSSSLAISLWCLPVAEPNMALAGWEKRRPQPQHHKAVVTLRL